MFNSNIFLSAVLMGFTLIFFGQNLFDPEYFTAGVDVYLYHFWNKFYIAERLAEGGLPLWSPYNYAGHPFVANPENNVFYPFGLLYYFFPLVLAFELNILFHIFLAGLGVLVLGRALGLGSIARLSAALVFMFSGYMIDRIAAGHLIYMQSAAYLPWLIFCVERLVQTQRVNWSIGFAIFFSLSILGGTPQNCYYLALASGIYFATRTLFQTKRTQWLSLSACFLFGLVLTVLLTLIQVLPTLELMTQSDRSETSFEFVTYLSFPFENFLTLLLPGYRPNPYAYWEYTIYSGVLAVGLALLGLIASRKHHAVVCLGVLALFTITCMLGENTPIYRLYYALIPGIDMFRIPARSGVLLVFCIAIFAGFGTQYLVRKTTSSRYHWVTLIVPLVLFSDLYINYQPSVPRFPTADIWKPWFTEQRFLNKLDENTLDRVGVGREFAHARAMGLKYYDVNAYTPLAIERYFRLVHELAGVPVSGISRPALAPEVFDEPHPYLFRLLNLKYAVDSSGKMSEAPPSKRAFFVHKARVVPDAEEVLDLLKSESVDIDQEVILEKPWTFSDPGAPSSPDSTASTTIIEYSAERIVMQVNSDTRGYLVLSEVFYPGWRAEVDGIDTEILRANYAFRAIPVEAGNHRVVVRYQPDGFRLGAFISGTTLAVLLLWFVFFGWRGFFLRDEEVGEVGKAPS